ncbi:ATP-binding protein, partial [Pseudomonas aeruginosa]
YEAGRSLLLVGNVGTGKTHLGSAIVQHVIRAHGAQAVIVSAAQVIRVAKGAMARNAQYTERDVLAELVGFDLLVIDEVGAQGGTEYERGLLH